MRTLLAALDANDYFPHHFKLLPVDSGFVFTYKSLVALFCRHQVATMQREERDSLGKRIVPRKPIGGVTARGTHEDHQSHKLLLTGYGNQLPRLGQAMDRRAIDGRNDGTKSIIIILTTKFLFRRAEKRG